MPTAQAAFANAQPAPPGQAGPASAKTPNGALALARQQRIVFGLAHARTLPKPTSPVNCQTEQAGWKKALTAEEKHISSYQDT
jgi:hypothetical protein